VMVMLPLALPSTQSQITNPGSTCPPSLVKTAGAGCRETLLHSRSMSGDVRPMAWDPQKARYSESVAQNAPCWPETSELSTTRDPHALSDDALDGLRRGIRRQGNRAPVLT
jgi:hypothetical protein